MSSNDQVKSKSAGQNGYRSKIANGLISEDLSDEPSPDVKVSHIIGDFGPYQIAVVIFSALRAMACAIDGLSGPFISPNVKHFQCEICDPTSSTYGGNLLNMSSVSDGSCTLLIGEMGSKTRYEIDTSHCYFNNLDSIRPDRISCNKWSFNNSDNDRLIHSLTIEQSLVCDREWLKSFTNSMYYVGATFGLLFWGVISDRYGRKTAYVCSHFVTLTFSFSALFAQSMTTYVILRSINAFGMIGELIPRSIQVEIVATEYRFVCSVICQIGWALGIILIPSMAYFNSDYKFILAIPVTITFLMTPWIIWLPESARWLITNNNYMKARNELRRAAKINGKLTDDIDLKIEQFNRQVLREEVDSNVKHKRIGVGQSIIAIFTNMHLLKDTMAVFLLLFVAEVVYFSLTLNVADLGGSLYINYVISGFSELVSIAFCAFLLAYLSRRMCLSLLLLASTISYLLMALVNVYEESLSMSLILAVNAFGKLTAIGNLMVIILVSQEVFPTVIRQFGTSLCITVGKAGSAVAPFTHELGQVIGHSYCFAMFSLVCFTCAFVPFGLSETGNRELPDTVIDVEEGANRLNKIKRRASKRKDDANSYVAHYESNGSITKLQSEIDSNNNLTTEIIDVDKSSNKRLDRNNNLSMITNSLLDKKQQQQMIDDQNNNSQELNSNISNTRNSIRTDIDGIHTNVRFTQENSNFVDSRDGDNLSQASSNSHQHTYNQRL